MEIEISTPALLFPAISLLLLAYTNRFLTTGQLIRSLSRQAREQDGGKINGQIENLKKRLELTKWMQFFGVVSMLLCTISMFSLFSDRWLVVAVAIVVVSIGLCCIISISFNSEPFCVKIINFLRDIPYL